MNVSKIENQARQMAAKAKPGMLKVGSDVYTFEFDQKEWVYVVYKNLFFFIRFNCKDLKTAKRYLIEHLEN